MFLSLLQGLKNNAIIVNLVNGAASTPVSITPVILRDLFFGEWMDEMEGAGGVAGVQSVTVSEITVPFCSISLDAGAVAAQRNSGIDGRTHSTVTTTNHLEVVAGDVRSPRPHTILPTFLYRASSHDHLHSIVG